MILFSLQKWRRFFNFVHSLKEKKRLWSFTIKSAQGAFGSEFSTKNVCVPHSPE